MALIERDDYLRPAVYGRGKHMPVFEIVRHCPGEVFEIRHPRVCKVASQLTFQVGRLKGRQADLRLESSLGFTNDLVGPERPIQGGRFGQAQSEVAQSRLNKYAGVEYGDSRNLAAGYRSSAPCGRATLS